jgi:hypothetical protein
MNFLIGRNNEDIVLEAKKENDQGSGYKILNFRVFM